MSVTGRLEALQVYPKICVIQLGDKKKSMARVRFEERALCKTGKYPSLYK